MNGSITQLVETLVAAGCTPDMILSAVRTAEATKDRDQDAFDAADEERKEKARARFHKWKANKAANVSKRQLTLANDLRGRDLENKQTNKQENKRERATRLPTDWQTPEEWIDEAIAAGLTRAQALTEANRMKNWSLSDKNGAKLNWHATWQNWFLRALESQAKATGPPKKVTVASMWRDEGRKLGILPDEHPHKINGRSDASLGDGPAPSSNFARRIAGA